LIAGPSTCSATDLQDEQAAVMDRLVWQPQPAHLLNSVQIKQVRSIEEAGHCMELYHYICVP
jgi:hypothetical protein